MNLLQSASDEDLRTYRTVTADLAKKRREELAADGCCINGRHHEKPAAGGIRCPWCVAVHRYGLSVVLSDPSGWTPPPNYRPRRSVTPMR